MLRSNPSPPCLICGALSDLTNLKARRVVKQLHHPIQRAVEDVYATGHTPRLQVDARRVDVVVPEFIRKQWQARLVIDLDPSYPLNLEYTKVGVEVDLAFQGQITRCVFSWSSIYAIIDRSTGRGIVVEAHLPPAELEAALIWVDKPKPAPKNGRKPSPLRALSPSGAKPEKAAKAKAAKAEAPVEAEAPPAKETKPAARVMSLADRRKSSHPIPMESAAMKLDTSDANAETPPPSNPKEDEAKARRARFRVIDGGQ